MSDVPSEKTQAKAAEYLLSGRVKVQWLSTHTETGDHGSAYEFVAHVMSASQEPGDPYYVKFNALGWHCDCPARVQVCAHILACQTITDFPGVEILEKPTLPRDPDLDALLEGI